jgi:4'-phosphopantetheinyl transferase
MPVTPDELHIWYADLDRDPAAVRGLRRLLAGDERERADRFRFERDRSRYTVARGLLRTIIGRYLGCAPEAVRFEYGPFGKPMLAGAAGPWFNVSHSGAAALFGFSSSAELGVDIELERIEVDRERIARRFFSPIEAAALEALPEDERARAFLSCWTRKEAFIKARGDGMSLALDSFDVTLGPGQPAAVVRTAWSSEEPTQWSLSDLSDPERGYVAAVAVRATGWQLIQRRVSDIIDGELIGTED